MQLATIGYEGASLADFISTLVTAGIERVVDVRQIAQSRRPGFSKNALRYALSEAGIDYQHTRQLGVPIPGREAARAEKIYLFRTIYFSHLERPASQDALTEAVSLAQEKKTVLVCFERDPKYCHRTIVAERLAALSSLKITNLGVQPKAVKRKVDNVGAARGLAGAC